MASGVAVPHLDPTSSTSAMKAIYWLATNIESV